MKIQTVLSQKKNGTPRSFFGNLQVIKRVEI